MSNIGVTLKPGLGVT